MRVPADPARHEGRVVHGQVGERRCVAKMDRSVLHAVAANVITTIPSEQSFCIVLVRWQVLKALYRSRPSFSGRGTWRS